MEENVKHPSNIEFNDDFPNQMTEKQHNYLLDYLLHRLDQDKTKRESRIRRYARIDKFVSTWQQLSPEDSARAAKAEQKGSAVAINMNVPLLQTHVDDMAAFLAQIYSPVSGEFHRLPLDKAKHNETVLKVVKKLNSDAKACGGFTQLTKVMRSLIKYNIGGVLLRFDSPTVDKTTPIKGNNVTSAIDMYNLFWDPTVTDPAKIREEAEWAAVVEIKNRLWLYKQQKTNEFVNLAGVLDEDMNTNSDGAAYYRAPPNSAGIAHEDATSTEADGTNRISWETYGAGLAHDTLYKTDGYEVVRMWCWLNPGEFGLEANSQQAAREDGYYCWEFYIIDGKHIVKAKQLYATPQTDDTLEESPRAELPVYVGHLLVDDMGEAQRSVAELLRPFQTFGSFLFNQHVLEARSAIYGGVIYDPTAVDMTRIPDGEATFRVPTKQAGRDVRSIMSKLETGNRKSETLNDFANLMTVVEKFFPAQAMPSQVAGIDRAIQSQVAATLQGISRRLHMLVRVMDDSILGPYRRASLHNLIDNAVEDIGDLTEEDMQSVVGSGLEQLNREAAAQAMQQLLFAILQNPEAATTYDVAGLIEYWSTLLNMSVSASNFVRQQPEQTQQPQPMPGEPSPQIQS